MLAVVSSAAQLTTIHILSDELFFEDWGATYGSPYLVDEDASGEEATLAEPVDPFARTPELRESREMAFVDGVRRVEGFLYHRGDDGVLARGVAGAHACGAVVVHADGIVAFDRLRSHRMLILGSGRRAELATLDGYAWESHAIASADFDAPMMDLQRRMREAEARLAEQLSLEGWLTIVDGPLNFVRSLDEPVVGYVKTHLRRRLPQALHARIPDLGVGQRTPLFLARQSYSAYVRVAPGARHSNPWSGIVRIEVPESQGLVAARDRADEIACCLPRFAGVPHKDPRAPQNLLPIAQLERRLRHRLGPADRAARAIRLAVGNRTAIPSTS
jgi:uncharacterized protein